MINKMLPITVVPSEVSHVREMKNNIREKDRLEAERMGLDPRKGLFRAYRNSVWRRTILVEDKVAAMCGVYGMALSGVGQPYLITSPIVESVSPIRFARVYRNELNLMKQLFPVLENYVDANYLEAVRMLRLTGFEISKEPVKLGPNNCDFLKFSIRSSEVI